MLKSKLLQYSITTVSGAIVVFLFVWWRGIFAAESITVIWRYLVDAFFAVGAILIGFGGLVWLANAGAFRFFAYGFYRFFTLFKRDPARVKWKTYYEYQEAKAEDRTPFLFLIVVGAVFLAISLVFLIPYYQNYVPVSTDSNSTSEEILSSSAS